MFPLRTRAEDNIHSRRMKRQNFFLLLLCFYFAGTVAHADWAMVTVPVADLRSDSGTLPSSHDYDPKQESQLLYGEKVRIIELQGDWVRVEAIEQQEFSHHNVWEGYPGWMLKSALVPTDKFPNQDFVVRRKSVQLLSSPDISKPLHRLSIGTRLAGASVSKKHFRKIVTPSGKSAWIKEDDISPSKSFLSETVTRDKVVRSALELLGDLYFWGGRSANIPELNPQVTAVDCSGLVQLAYRVAGMDLPRDSLEQYMKAAPVTRAALKKGDLIFSADKEKPGKVSHVAIYMEDETLIEAPKTGQAVHKTTFMEKYGAELKDIESGSVVGTRIIYFGTYFSQ